MIKTRVLPKPSSGEALVSYEKIILPRDARRYVSCGCDSPMPPRPRKLKPFWHRIWAVNNGPFNHPSDSTARKPIRDRRFTLKLLMNSKSFLLPILLRHDVQRRSGRWASHR